MFRKKRPNDPAENIEAMMSQVRELRPALDARIDDESGATDPATRAQLLVARAVSRLADRDHTGALQDVDAASSLGEVPPKLERAAAVVLAQAVVHLGLAERRTEALARLEALPTEGVAPERLQHARLERVRLLAGLGRHDDARAVILEGPIDIPPGPRLGERLLARAQILLMAGDAERSLADVDAALAAGLGPESARTAANEGAYCIAVLARADRLEEALAWANLACSTGTAGAPAGAAERDTRAAVLAVAGRGAEAIPDLDAGLAALTRTGDAGPALGWSHAFLARANLDAGHVDRARKHLEQARAASARTPVIDAVARDLAAHSPTAAGPDA